MGRRPHLPDRHRLLLAWAGFVTTHPWLTVTAAVLLATAALGITATRLEFHADRDELIDPTLPWQQRHRAFKQAFPRWDDAIVVIDSATAPAETIEAFTAALAAGLEADPRFGRIDAGFPASEAPAGLVLSEPVERIESIVRELGRAAPVLSASGLADLIRFSMLGVGLDERQRSELKELLKRAAAVGRGEATELLPGAPSPMQRLTVGDGRLITVLVSLNGTGGDSLDQVQEGIVGLRDRIRDLRSEQRFAGVEAGVTGVPVLEADEAAQSMADATRASILAFALIAALMMIVYRGAVIPLLGMASLLLGVAWSFGWLTLSVGHLQLLSSVFAVILLGLGVDTAIHLIARLELVHPDHDHMPTAVGQAFLGVGPGVLTGAITTAAAFAATAFTEFDGVAEMGLIAAGGVILCAVSVMSCFPALLEILRRPENHLRARSGGASRPFMGGALRAVDRRPLLFVLCWVVILTGAGLAARNIHYDPDLLKLLPPTAESVRWEKRLEQVDDRSVWHAVVVAETRDEAKRLAEDLRTRPLVADVGGAGALFPDDVDRKQALLRSLPAPSEIQDEAPNAEALREAAQRLRLRYEQVDPELAAAAGVIATADEKQLQRIEHRSDMQRDALADRVRSLRAAAPPMAVELPETLRSQWIGSGGEYLLRIYPEAPAEGGAGSVLARGRLEPFAEQVLTAAPDATGPVIQIHESTMVITRAYVRAAGLAAIVILLILLVDFRRLGDALCALIPVAGGLLLLLGALALLEVDLNFANTIVMPLIIGLGVDAGVHIVHRWRQQPWDSPAGLAGGAGRAITLTTFTTAIGFASMALAEHRGIRSLGVVMTLGLLLTWTVAIGLLPAILRLRTSRSHPGWPGAHRLHSGQQDVDRVEKHRRPAPRAAEASSRDAPP